MALAIGAGLDVCVAVAEGIALVGPVDTTAVVNEGWATAVVNKGRATAVVNKGRATE